jgi:uncharacterized iron-regulated protein
VSDPTSTRLRLGAYAIVLAAAAILAAAVIPVDAPARASETCAPASAWSVPGGGPISAQDVLARAATARVVLLGESHDSADHHRWELQTVAALAALHPKIALGFEMFPRRVQPALERWVAGELSEEEFLQASDWSRVWSYDPALYLPLFHFARLNRVPMLALNVERELVRAVGARGYDAIPAETREGVSAPAAASDSYLERLFEAYAQHPDKSDSAPARTDPAFRRFVEAQLVWDRAMAQVLVEAAQRDPDGIAIGIMGSRHIAHGEGVAHQIESLGVQPVVSLLPWDAGDDCAGLTAGLASAVFGLPASRRTAADAPPRLGIQIRAVAGGVLVAAVENGSIAEATGLRADDVLVEVAGAPVTTPDAVRALVLRMAPGTWLPLKLKRQADLVELTAKFPARP